MDPAPRGTPRGISDSDGGRPSLARGDAERPARAPPLVREVVVDRCAPDVAWVAETLGVPKIAQPPLAHTRFTFVIDAGAVGAFLAGVKNDWLPPPTASAALANAIRRVFVQELPGPAITFDREGLEGDPATYETNSGRMREDFVIHHQVKQIALAPSTRIGLRLALEVPKVAGTNPRTVRAGDLRLESGGGLPDGILNPDTVIAYLYPGEYLSIRGLVVTERSPEGHYPEHAVVPRCGTGPVGVPEVPVELWAVGAQTRPTKEDALSALAELAEESYVPEEIAAKLRERVAAGDASHLVSKCTSEPVGGAGGGVPESLVSLADMSRHTKPAALVATGWEVVATAKALPAGKNSCRQIAIRAASHLRSQLQRFDRALASVGTDPEKSAIHISAEISEGGRTTLSLDAPDFTKTVGDLAGAFGNTASVTVSSKMWEVLRLVVSAPGGADEAVGAVRRGCSAALEIARMLEKDLTKSVERTARPGELVTTEGSGL